MKFHFTTDNLPKELAPAEHLTAWRKLVVDFFTLTEFDPLEGVPLHVNFKAMMIGPLRVAQFRGTMARFERSADLVEAAHQDDFIIGINSGDVPFSNAQAGRETLMAPGSAVLATTGEAGALRADKPCGWTFVAVPRPAILEICPGAEELIGRAFAPDNPALVHLRRYLDFLLEMEGSTEDAEVRSHIDSTLSDIIALMISRENEMMSVARLSGPRAAHLRAILNTLRTNYREPNLTLEEVSEQLGLSARYIQSVLTEAGTTFVERLAELRLQHAKSWLSLYSRKHLKISEIAYAAGFGDVSYFNRRFKTRFGMSPSEYQQQISPGPTQI